MKAQDMAAFCGLTCHGCPIHWATQEEDPAKKRKMRVALARLGKEHYGIEMQPEEITDCDGCRSEPLTTVGR
jgi:hypothetical protein